ncbi:cryptococcal mannosyltransferase 1-domain-containing protein [Aspergillus germanicus]
MRWTICFTSGRGNRRGLSRMEGGVVGRPGDHLQSILTGLRMRPAEYMPTIVPGLDVQLSHQKAYTGRSAKVTKSIRSSVLDAFLALANIILCAGRVQESVFLSIYDNNSGGGRLALESLAEKVLCSHSIISEPGEQLVRRIDYLAELRNRALRPLEREDSPRYDKLLYLKNVVFDPVEALQLLLCTNADADGVAQYRAACAVDFTNPFKFYDTYATPICKAGDAQSKQEVLRGHDAVRVRSCWGGIVAFDANFFQKQNPVRFRVVEELFWIPSECCLIHADIQKPVSDTDDITDSGIYMSPFVWVAYDARTFEWLWTTRRFERLYPLVHGVVLGQKVHHTVWMRDDSANGGKGVGSWKTVEREATNDGFCGRRRLEVVVEDRKSGQDGSEAVPIPHFPIR